MILSRTFLFGLLLGGSLQASDLFSTATEIVLEPGDIANKVIDTTVGATTEPGEPNHGGLPPQNTLWYRIQGNVDRRLEITGVPLTGDVAVAVYTGDSVDTLTLVQRYPNLPIPAEAISGIGEGEILSLFANFNFDAQANVPYYIAVGRNQTAGDFELYVSPARDENTPVVELLAPGAQWEYLQALEDQPDPKMDPADPDSYSKRDPALDDPDFYQTWMVGDDNYDGPAFQGPSAAPFAYGSLISFPPDAGTTLRTPTDEQRNAASYFRTVLTPEVNIRGLAFEGLFDDGAIFFINGVEVGRENIEEGPADFDIEAITGRLVVAEFEPINGERNRIRLQTEDVTQFFSVDGLSLPAGQPIDIAVSVHNVSDGSSDSGFDLRIWGTQVEENVINPRVTSTASGDLEVRWDTFPAQRYQIEFTTDLSNPDSWSPLLDQAVTGAGGLMVQTIAPSAAKGFLRVVSGNISDD